MYNAIELIYAMYILCLSIVYRLSILNIWKLTAKSKYKVKYKYKYKSKGLRMLIRCHSLL